MSRYWSDQMSLCFAAAAAAFLLCLHANAQMVHGDEYDGLCKTIMAAPAPKPVTTGPIAAGKLEGCDAEALYYGYPPASKPDYPAALQCAWWQRAHPQPSVGDMFYGPGVLTMLYANGYGVPKDLGKAKRFACEQGWASPMEMVGRMQHLQKLEGGATEKDPFDMCDDITSGLSMGACQAIDSRKSDAARDRQIIATTANLPAAAKSLLPALRKADLAFDTAKADNEVDLTGTARAMLAFQEEDRQKQQFLINLQRFGKGDVPAASEADAKALDAQMNAAYSALAHRSKADYEQGGTVEFSGIQKTQRAWVALRDAWLPFAAAAYPKLSRSQVEAQLIRLRLHQLRAL